jgi:hypothetical protein
MRTRISMVVSLVGAISFGVSFTDAQPVGTLPTCGDSGPIFALSWRL